MNKPKPKIHLIGKFDHKPNTEMLLTIDRLAQRTGYSKSHLSNLLRTGKMAGDKTLNTWLTTFTAFVNYKEKIEWKDG